MLLLLSLLLLPLLLLLLLLPRAGRDIPPNPNHPIMTLNNPNNPNKHQDTTNTNPHTLMIETPPHPPAHISDYYDHHPYRSRVRMHVHGAGHPLKDRYLRKISIWKIIEGTISNNPNNPNNPPTPPPQPPPIPHHHAVASNYSHSTSNPCRRQLAPKTSQNTTKVAKKTVINTRNSRKIWQKRLAIWHPRQGNSYLSCPNTW
jgi:hypothetical protein